MKYLKIALCVIALCVLAPLLMSFVRIYRADPAKLITPEALVAEDSSLGDADLPALQRGKEILTGKCVFCHRLRMPYEYSPEEWSVLVNRMGQYAALSNDRVTDLKTYVVGASRAAK